MGTDRHYQLRHAAGRLDFALYGTGGRNWRGLLSDRTVDSSENKDIF